MTFTEISQTAGCGINTVRRWAKKLWPERAFTGKFGAGLNEQDAHKLMDSLPKRNKIKSAQMAAYDFVSMIPVIVAETVKQLLPVLQATHQSQKSLPFIPDIPIRKQIANVVGNWAVKKCNHDFEAAYRRLYKNFGDRYGINVEKRAENKGIKPIEYLEREGKLEELYICAIQIFQEAV